MTGKKLTRPQAAKLGTLARLERKRTDDLAHRKATWARRERDRREDRLYAALACPVLCGGSIHPEHELDAIQIDEMDARVGKSFLLDGIED